MMNISELRSMLAPFKGGAVDVTDKNGRELKYGIGDLVFEEGIVTIKPSWAAVLVDARWSELKDPIELLREIPVAAIDWQADPVREGVRRLESADGVKVSYFRLPPKGRPLICGECIGTCSTSDATLAA